MKNFTIEEQLNRMKELYTYGKVNENTSDNRNLEYYKEAADGRVYGIVKENAHYYIKVTNPKSAKLAESYDYIGGFMNKKNYQYDSYANALKNLEMKIASINEAQDAHVETEALDPYRKQITLAECTQQMADEIARQRQIMHNVNVLMQEGTDFSVKGGESCNTKQPEAPSCKGKDCADKGKEVKPDPEFSGKHVNLNTKEEPFTEAPSKITEGCDESCEEGSKDCDGAVCEKCGKNSEECTCDKEADVTESDDEKLLYDDQDSSDESIKDAQDSNVDLDSMTDFDFDDYDFDDDDFDEDEFDDDFEEEGSRDDDEFDDDVENVDDFDDEELDNGNDEESFDDEDSEFDDENNLDPSNSDASEDDEDDIDDTEKDDEVFDDEEHIHTDDADFDDEMKESISSLLGEKINEAVDAVVNNLLKETELHDFGKHPGYRKKPMTTPPTGSDKTEHGKDINDDSVHSEEPFGTKIGDGMPFNILVDRVTKSVIATLSEMGDKKKVK